MYKDKYTFNSGNTHRYHQLDEQDVILLSSNACVFTTTWNRLTLTGAVSKLRLFDDACTVIVPYRF